MAAELFGDLGEAMKVVSEAGEIEGLMGAGDGIANFEKATTVVTALGKLEEGYTIEKGTEMERFEKIFKSVDLGALKKGKLKYISGAAFEAKGLGEGAAAGEDMKRGDILKFQDAINKLSTVETEGEEIESATGMAKLKGFGLKAAGQSGKGTWWRRVKLAVGIGGAGTTAGVASVLGLSKMLLTYKALDDSEKIGACIFYDNPSGCQLEIAKGLGLIMACVFVIWLLFFS